MKLPKLVFSTLALAAIAMLATDARAGRYSTYDPGGADTELRESAPGSARGGSTEIASRISGAGGRNSVIYLKFNVADISAAELAKNITVRTTLRNNNISSGRIENPNVQNGATAGFDYFVLDPNLAGADWDEATLTPQIAHAQGLGYVFDGDFYTKPTGTVGSPTAGLTYLGSNSFDPDDIGANGWIPIGTPYDLITVSPNSALHQGIVAAQATAHKTVTLVLGVSHAADHPVNNWLNFNYLFNPKEMEDVINDSSSPWNGVSRAGGAFAPVLLTVPEPASFALLALAGLAIAGCRKRG